MIIAYSSVSIAFTERVCLQLIECILRNRTLVLQSLSMAYTRVSVAYFSLTIAFTSRVCLLLTIECRLLTLVFPLPLHNEGAYCLS